jgi:hypothetical protein
MRFEVIKGVNIKIVVLWTVTPRSMVDRANISEKSETPNFRVGEYSYEMLVRSTKLPNYTTPESRGRHLTIVEIDKTLI